MKVPARLKAKRVERSVEEAARTASSFLAKEYPRVGDSGAATPAKPRHVAPSPQAQIQSPVALAQGLPLEVSAVKPPKKAVLKKSKFPPLDRKKAPWRF